MTVPATIERVYLIGLMGAGKSTVGRLLAEVLSWTFIDLDAEISAAAGKSIPNIFADLGENVFREFESRLLQQTLSKKQVVIACGGGVILQPENIKLLKQELTVWLELSPAEAAARLEHAEKRPLLNECEDTVTKLNEILNSRRQAYTEVARIRVNSGGLAPELIASKILSELATHGKHTALKVKHQTGEYQVLVGSDLLSDLVEHLAGIQAVGPLGIITNSTVNDLYGDQIRETLRAAGFVTRTILVPDGEAFKTLASAEQLISALIAQGMERSGTILALGGGVITDLGGFVASILFRGVKLVHLPTTLLAMVDAAVGGKTGVNHIQGKNLIGSFYQPSLVLMDVDTLTSLDHRDRVSGFAEMLKMGIIRDPAYLDQLYSHREQYLSAAPGEELARAIAHSVELKAQVVEADEKEAALRRILNFGHTVGHAIETTLGYGVIRHGEAVILGMYAAGWLSHQLTGLSDAQWLRLSDILVAVPLKAPIQNLDSNAIELATRMDKKVANSDLYFVLLKEIGEPHMQSGIPSLMIKLAVDAIKKAWKDHD